MTDRYIDVVFDGPPGPGPGPPGSFIGIENDRPCKSCGWPRNTATPYDSLKDANARCARCLECRFLRVIFACDGGVAFQPPPTVDEGTESVVLDEVARLRGFAAAVLATGPTYHRLARKWGLADEILALLKEAPDE